MSDNKKQGWGQKIKQNLGKMTIAASAASVGAGFTDIGGIAPEYAPEFGQSADAAQRRTARAPKATINKRLPTTQKAPDFSVCYGQPMAPGDLLKFNEAIVEPGFYFLPNGQPTSPIRNVRNNAHVAVAYIPLAALNTSNLVHKGAIAAITAKSGWLIDNQGTPVVETTQTPNDTLWFDLRKPAVKGIMTEAILHVVNAGYGGVFFDMMDRVTLKEMSDPNTYGGLRKATIEFVKEISTEIKKKHPDFKIIVSGFSGRDEGLEGGDPLVELAPHVDFACIQQSTQDGKFKGMQNNDRAYTIDRIRAAAEARQKANGDNKSNPLKIYPIEPDAPQELHGAPFPENTEPGRKLIQEVVDYWKDVRKDDALKGFDRDLEILSPYLALSNPAARYSQPRYYGIEQEPGEAQDPKQKKPSSKLKGGRGK